MRNSTKFRVTSMVVLAAILLTLFGAENALRAQSAYVPTPFKLVISPSYTFETFDEFYRKRDKTELSVATAGAFEEIDQHTFSVAFDYGLWEDPDIALDLTLGYVRISTVGQNDEDGLADTQLGVRWRVLNELDFEYPLIPTVSLRFGGTIEGTYDVRSGPFTAGDGASGVGGNLLVAKSFGDTGITFVANAGLRYRAQDVPNEFTFNVGLSKAFMDNLVLSLSYDRIQSLSGKDLGDPGVTAVDFPALKEIRDTIMAGFGVLDDGGRYYGVFFAQTISGRNTGDQTIVGVNFDLSFDSRSLVPGRNQ